MKIDLSWFKYTALDAVQHAANTFLAIGGGDALNLWHLDYKVVLGASAGAALVSVLRSVVAYKLPDTPKAVVSAAASLASSAPFRSPRL